MTSTQTVRPSVDNGTALPVLSTRIIQTALELEKLVPAWHELVDRCSWRNPCYEPEFLIPLFSHCASEPVSVMIVEGACGPSKPVQVLGLLPLIQQPFYRLPVKCVHAWRPDEAFDATPLLDGRYSTAVLEAIMNGCQKLGNRIMAFDTVSAAPEFDGLIRDLVVHRGAALFDRDRFTRAALVPSASADEYLANRISNNRLRKARRALNRLQNVGEVCFVHSDGCQDLHQWASEFLDLESSGWKGRAGTALASQPHTLAFFLEMVDRCQTRSAIRFGKMTLDGTTIAMLADLRCGDQISGFKTTYDERYSDHSPGFLLEMQNIRWLHELGCRICDSCTSPNNELINGIYADRLAFQSIVIGLDRHIGNRVIGMLPLLQQSAAALKTIRQTVLKTR